MAIDPSVLTTDNSGAPTAPAPQPTTQPVAPDVAATNAPPTAPTTPMPVAPAQTAPGPPPKATFGESFARGMQGPKYEVTGTGETINAAPDRAASRAGILGGALSGILRGALEGLQAPTDPNGRGKGSAFASGARYASEQDKQRDATARAQAQKDFQQKQQATQAKLENNLTLARTHDLIQKSQFDVEDHAADLKSRGITDEQHQLEIQNILDQRRQLHADLQQVLVSHGINPYATVSQTPVDGKSIAEQAQPHIGAMVAGKGIPVQSGGVGDSNGASLFSSEDLDRPITKGETLTVPYFDGTKDNDGKFQSHDRAITADGRVTYADLARQYLAADAQLDSWMKKDAAAMGAQQKKADLAKTGAETKNQNAEANEHQAAANKTNADIKLQKDLNPDSATGLEGNAYLQTLPQGLRSTVQGIGEGRMTYSDRQLFDSKTGLPTPTMQAVTRAYPDFDVSKAKAWQKTRDEYMGQGATAKKIVSYNTSMEHMQDLFDSTTNQGMFDPLSKDYQKREAALGFVTQEVGSAVKNGVMSESEGKQITKGISGGLTPGLNRERVQETAKLLHDKLDEYQKKFDAGAPSSAVRVPTLMSVQGANAYDYVRSGGKIQPQNTPAQTFTVGDPVMQDGQWFTVTSVDANGKVTGAK